MKCMTISERFHLKTADPYNIRLLLDDAIYSTCLREQAFRFATTSEWQFECRFENICYKILADYCY